METGAIGPTVLAYSLIYITLKPYTTKARLYLSLINSLYLSIVAAQTYTVLVPNYHSPTLADYIIGYFTTDLLLGHVFDRKNLNILTGYIHHSAFICLIWYVKTTNETNLIYMLLPFEIPTLLLDLSRVYKTKILDYSFGISFFTFRIIHNIVILRTLISYYKPYALIVTALLILHLHWFRNWYIKIHQIE